ncbi:MAG: hypothetical protein IJX66_04460 [Lachnospiraceae bacterium]|nr:hypothetical protein [Lachnospiraceae bacterium]MBQ9135327.1 hypothetical protein [Lachnospiraceae bacterium]
MEKVKEVAKNLFCGETIVNKRDLWFIGAICFLGGIVYGLVTAPWTHGVTIGSNNGNGCSCCCDDECDCECDEECCK